jgi:uncharacterized protein (UPF0264 family)
VAKLLVSVRSAIEARIAVAAGAAIVDIKEPLKGSLGRAPCSVWRAVRASVPDSIPISVALGELTDWFGPEAFDLHPESWAGISYCKLGLAGAPADWPRCWQDLRRRLSEHAVGRPSWVGVAYIDWRRAGSPPPEEIIQACLSVDECRGVLFDTWDKSHRATIDLTWKPWLDQVRDSGRFVALAGSLADVDAEKVVRLVQAVSDSRRETGSPASLRARN